MEYRREEKKEKRKKRKGKSDVQIVNSISMMEENGNPKKTKWEEFAGFVSRWKAPSLKTVGRMLTNFHS